MHTMYTTDAKEMFEAYGFTIVMIPYDNRKYEQSRFTAMVNWCEKNCKYCPELIYIDIHDVLFKFVYAKDAAFFKLVWG